MTRKMTESIINKLLSHRLPLHDEKYLQVEIGRLLPEFKREYSLDANSTIDFFHNGIGIEVKIKGSRREIYRQIERYCRFKELHTLILATNRAMGLPKKINNVSCIVVNFGRAWL